MTQTWKEHYLVKNLKLKECLSSFPLLCYCIYRTLLLLLYLTTRSITHLSHFRDLIQLIHTHKHVCIVTKWIEDIEQEKVKKMEFTEAYKQTGPCAFSPNSRFIAVAVDYRLVIRDLLSLKVLTSHLSFFNLKIFYLNLCEFDEVIRWYVCRFEFLFVWTMKWCVVMLNFVNVIGNLRKWLNWAN